MATMTVSLPDQMKDWIEAQIRKGEYASTSDYVRDLVRKDRARRGEEYTIEELREIFADAKASGISEKTVEEIRAEALQIARARGLIRD
ncbi:type II toxin-antitoxin system ParD family antitoxin [Rhizobium jaguaris]|uniref:Type II toxin-antitoxin system ParD family antitoxin n=1 Tax=Rhizobium jaguaris TaxID=1312183 RepID=A0A387FRW9_9HYPH|nr:type II toxin-antitoxin system ParD family antitoxin [Rhizobium jaguaris]AYG60155.1 type II toxin-antitoxin system ParD family antitoxin [Rhizobium jaguaris]